MPRRTLPKGNRSLAKQMRRQMPDAEFRLWCELRNCGLDGLRFRRQHPIGNYIVDFFCANSKLIVEVDGEQHSAVAHQVADAQRTRWLEAQGYRVVQFWTNEVMHELEGFARQFSRLHEASGRTTPLPKPADAGFDLPSRGRLRAPTPALAWLPSLPPRRNEQERRPYQILR
jgi:very-short-patch-repair endonuclease